MKHSHASHADAGWLPLPAETARRCGSRTRRSRICIPCSRRLTAKGFRRFLVERTFSGADGGRRGAQAGDSRVFHLAHWFLQDCRVPVENLLGEPGKGHHIAFNVLNVGRFKTGRCMRGRSAHGDDAHDPVREGAEGVWEGDRGVRADPAQDWPRRRRGSFAAESMAYRTVGMMDAAVGRRGS